MKRAVPTWRTAGLLFLGALIIRVVAIAATGFDGLYGQDAYAYFDQAMALRNFLVHGIPVPGGFFWPQGYPCMVALMSLIVGPIPAAGQLVSLVMGALIAPLTFMVGRRLLPSGNDGASVLAAILMAIGGQAVLSSIVIMSDAGAMALILLSMWMVLEFKYVPQYRSLLALGVAFAGAAVSFRWASILVGPALAAPACVALTRGRRSVTVLPFLIAGTVAVSGVFLGAVLNIEAFNFSGYFQDWRLLNAFWGPIPQIPPDSLGAKAPGLIYYLAPLYHPAFLGPLLGPLALWGLWKLSRNHDRSFPLVLVLWAVIPLLFFSGLPLRNLRFCLTNTVPFILLASWGIWTLLGSPALRKTKLVAVGLSLALIVAWGARRIATLTTATETLLHTIGSVETLVPSDAIILTFEITQAFEHRSQVENRELFDQDPVSLGTLIENGRPLYLLVQPRDIATRWHDQAPGVNTRWLEDHGALREIERWGPYTLRVFEQGGGQKAKHIGFEAML